MTTATDEVDNKSCDQLATCNKINEQEIKTVQRKPKVRTEDAEPIADRRSPMKTTRKSERMMMLGMEKKVKRQKLSVFSRSLNHLEKGCGLTCQ